MRLTITLFLLFISSAVFAQYEVTHDEFTGELSIDLAEGTETQEFGTENMGYIESSVKPYYFRTVDGDETFGLLFTYVSTWKTYDEGISVTIPALMDGSRSKFDLIYQSKKSNGEFIEAFITTHSRNEFLRIARAQDVKFRVNDNVVRIDNKTQKLIKDLFSELMAINSKNISLN